MQIKSPSYRINYQQCKQRTHQTQKTNLICLNQDCTQNSLICSFCLEEKHKGHATKPLKHFLESLSKKYQEEKQTTIDNDLQQLDSQKNFLLNNIKTAVQNLAEKFMQLQQQIIFKYEAIKSQIIEKEAKKNRFSAFYHAIAKQGKGDPNFEIQNYLQFQPLECFNLNNNLEKFISETNQMFEQIKKNMVLKKKDHISIEKIEQKNQLKVGDSNNFILPKSIKCNLNLFSQTLINETQNVVYLNTFLKQITGKVRIRIVSLPVTATLTLGVAKLKDILQSKQQFPFKTNNATLWVDSKGKFQKANYNHITSMVDGNIIDLTIRKNHCKIASKGSVCDIILPDKEESVIFFSMQGISQIQVLYPYKKN